MKRRSCGMLLAFLGGMRVVIGSIGWCSLVLVGLATWPVGVRGEENRLGTIISSALEAEQEKSDPCQFMPCTLVDSEDRRWHLDTLPSSGWAAKGHLQGGMSAIEGKQVCEGIDCSAEVSLISMDHWSKSDKQSAATRVANSLLSQLGLASETEAGFVGVTIGETGPRSLSLRAFWKRRKTGSISQHSVPYHPRDTKRQ